MDRLAVPGVRLLHDTKDTVGGGVLPDREMGASMTAIESWCRDADALLSDRKACQRALDAGDDPDGCYCPTPEEIAAACREIRAEWSEDDWRRRRVSRPVEYETPSCKVSRQSRKLVE